MLPFFKNKKENQNEKRSVLSEKPSKNDESNPSVVKNRKEEDHSTTSTTLDLKTEYEDAVQQRLTGKVVQCEDTLCTGDCFKYNQIQSGSNGLNKFDNSSLDETNGNQKSTENYTPLSNSENIPVEKSSRFFRYKQNALLHDSNLKGYVCVERMLDHYKIKEYKLDKTIGKGSFSKVKLGVVRESDLEDNSVQKRDTTQRSTFSDQKTDKSCDKMSGHSDCTLPCHQNCTFPAQNSASDQKFLGNVAVKIIPRNLRYNSVNKETKSKRETRIFKEAFITSVLHNSHIVKLKDFLYNSLHFFMVYEFVEGDSLLDHIRKHKYLSEQESKQIFRQLVCGISYLHQNNIVHRDLKIENILITKSGTVKIIDFGLSNFFTPKNTLNTFCGSLQFAAPELLRGIEYEGPEIDIWSLGIVLFVMVNGKLPFDDREISRLHAKIKKGSFKYYKSVSHSLKTLIQNTVQPDVFLRWSLSKVFNCEWLEHVDCAHCVKEKSEDNGAVAKLSKNLDRREVFAHRDDLEALLDKVAQPENIQPSPEGFNPRNVKFNDQPGSILYAMCKILSPIYPNGLEGDLKVTQFENMAHGREELTHRIVRDLEIKRSALSQKTTEKVEKKEDNQGDMSQRSMGYGYSFQNMTRMDDPPYKLSYSRLKGGSSMVEQMRMQYEEKHGLNRQNSIAKAKPSDLNKLNVSKSVESGYKAYKSTQNETIDRPQKTANLQPKINEVRMRDFYTIRPGRVGPMGRDPYNPPYDTTSTQSKNKHPNIYQNPIKEIKTHIIHTTQPIQNVINFIERYADQHRWTLSGWESKQSNIPEIFKVSNLSIFSNLIDIKNNSLKIELNLLRYRTQIKFEWLGESPLILRFVNESEQVLQR